MNTDDRIMQAGALVATNVWASALPVQPLVCALMAVLWLGFAALITFTGGSK